MKRRHGASNENRIKAQRSDDANAFIPESAPRNGAGDDLAQLLAENHQLSIVTDEDVEETLDALRTEEVGGPFLETRPEVEFGPTMSGSELDPDSESNSLPEAVGPLAIASAEEESEDAEARAEQTGEIAPADALDETPSHVEPDLAMVARPGRDADRPTGH